MLGMSATEAEVLAVVGLLATAEGDRLDLRAASVSNGRGRLDQ